MAFGDRITTFEDSEKESEYGYVRKVRHPPSSPPLRYTPLLALLPM
jgi:hypothetical protein